MGITLPLLIGLALAILAAMAVSAVHAWLSISVRADQIISGTIINIFAVGITGYLNLLISQHSPPSAGQFQALRPAVVPDRHPGHRPADRRAARGRTDRAEHAGQRDRAAGAPLPVALGPAHPVGRRAPEGRRDGGHRRHQAALPQRHPGRHLRRAGRRLPDHRVRQRVPGRDDGRSRLHRPGRADLRPLDADRRLRRGAAVHGLHRPAALDPVRAAGGRAGRLPVRPCHRSSTAPCRTSSPSSCWPAWSGAAWHRPRSDSRTSGSRRRPEGGGSGLGGSLGRLDGDRAGIHHRVRHRRLAQQVKRQAGGGHVAGHRVAGRTPRCGSPPPRRCR